MKDIIKSFVKSFVLSYKYFLSIIILNIIFVVPLYFLTYDLVFLNSKKQIYINKKAIVVINLIKQDKDVWFIISDKNNKRYIIITDYQKKDFVFHKSKNNNIASLNKNDFLAIKELYKNTTKETTCNITNEDFQFNVNIKYLKKGFTILFKVKKRASLNKTSVYIIIILSILIFLSLIEPIARNLKNIMDNKEAGVGKIIIYWKNGWYKSLFLNVIYVLVILIITININFLKNYDNIIFIILAVINIWLLFFILISYLWLIPISIYFKSKSLFKIIKKTILITLDNLLKTIFCALVLSLFFTITSYILVSLFGLYSVIILLIYPGFSWMLIFLHISLEKILNKYNNVINN